MQRRIWMCLTLGAWLPYVSYKWALGLFGGSSRGAQLLVYRWQLVRRGYTVLFHRAQGFGRDAHGTVREEGDTRLASQISRINPSDQWGDRCRSQIRPHIRMKTGRHVFYIDYQSNTFLTHGDTVSSHREENGIKFSYLNYLGLSFVLKARL